MPDLDWELTRQRAETVPCSHCHAAIGHTCRNRLANHRHLIHAPAHDARIKAANTADTQGANQ
ncbi:hypothetical protein [Nocardia sp. CC201C]|uniref:zinc finger domain-containing protein n=1 Tax=Nocardia sp. CC201C TaxID=3044575 RepID=UPI0024A98266|nr:hypothetical protein [Nocardia sp. CC201C]